MFDLTDDVENSPTQSTEKAKPIEVKTIDEEIKDLEKLVKPEPGKGKPQPENDDFNEYDYSDDKELDDKEW